MSNGRKTFNKIIAFLFLAGVVFSCYYFRAQIGEAMKSFLGTPSPIEDNEDDYLFDDFESDDELLADNELTATPVPTATPTPTSSPEPSSTPTPTLSPTPTDIPKNVLATIKVGNSSDKKINPLKELPVVSITDASIGDVIFFGSYEQDGDLENGPESIAWYVLDKNESEMFLLSVYALNRLPFDYNGISTWENSFIRRWLNSNFYNSSFTAVEKQQITLTSTNDHCFLLSCEEVMTYINNQHWDVGSWYLGMKNVGGFDYRYFANLTKYAFEQGLVGFNYVTGDTICCYQKDEDMVLEYDPDAFSHWWLRTEGFHPYSVAVAVGDGSITTNGFYYDTDYVSVRPAIKISIK